MTTDQTGDRSFLEGGAVQRTSDIALAAISTAVAAAVIASVEGTPFGSWSRLGVWFFPAAAAWLLLVAAAILFVRGCFFSPARPARWGQMALLVIAPAIGVLFLVGRAWGDTLALQYFGPSEFVALSLFQLAVAIALARSSRVRAAGMVCIGLLLASIGTDLPTGSTRLTMGLEELLDGIALPVVVLGLIVVADAAICLVSPTLLLATYARLVADWATPQIPVIGQIVMRIAAALALAAACVLAFQYSNSMWEVRELLVLGLFGVACKIFGWNRLVLILAFNHGPYLEENIRRALLISRGDLATFLRWPISAVLVATAVTILAAVALFSARRALMDRRSLA